MIEFNYIVRRALEFAEDIAREYGEKYVGSEHLLYSLMNMGGVAGEVLEKYVKESDYEKKLYELSPRNDQQVRGKLRKSEKYEIILKNARAEAEKQKTAEVTTAQVLLAILKENDCIAVRILNTLKVNFTELFAEIYKSQGFGNEEIRQELFSMRRVNGQGLLEQFTKDLTQAAKEEKLDPVIGRKDEIKRVLEVICRRTKNNPCLVGEPGVGKTAIVEGIAQLIAEGSVPDELADCRILTLDLSGMVAGTKYRGEFEERIKKVMAEVIAAGNIILFLDEIHTIIGAGSAEGTLDAANILKPALSRGELRIIGATTLDEYRKRIEKDAALERRFQQILVEEPDEAMSIEILEGLRDRLEDHHKLLITDSALSAAVKLSARYISDRCLPDKAIDCLDEACSRVRLKGFKLKPEMAELEEQIKELENDADDAFSDGFDDDYERITGQIKELRKKLKKLKGSVSPKKDVFVTEDDVAEVISVQSRVPVAKLKESENNALLNLEKTLHKRVIGQEEAIKAVAKAIRRGKAGVMNPNRPIGSFLFLGPTGVGKTELSKALAEAMFGKDTAIVRVDMSEYMEKHSVSKMIGSPPGYVGHEDGGQLSEQVRQKPYSIVLFDEIEKAHPDVFNILLQVLDEGRITDSQGRTVSFRNTVIIMTSNAGAQSIINPKQLGFSKEKDAKKDYEFMKNSVMEEVKRIFKPEFINRIDDIIVFHELTKDEIKAIVKLLLGQVAARLKESKGIVLKFKPALIDFISEKGYDPKYGARPVKRAIQDNLEDKLADMLLAGKIQEGDTINVTCEKGTVLLQGMRE